MEGQVEPWIFDVTLKSADGEGRLKQAQFEKIMSHKIDDVFNSEGAEDLRIEACNKVLAFNRDSWSYWTRVLRWTFTS
jgi:hypothetical protein